MAKQPGVVEVDDDRSLKMSQKPEWLEKVRQRRVELKGELGHAAIACYCNGITN